VVIRPTDANNVEYLGLGEVQLFGLDGEQVGVAQAAPAGTC
jgi:hypothetical protein